MSNLTSMIGDPMKEVQCGRGLPLMNSRRANYCKVLSQIPLENSPKVRAVTYSWHRNRQSSTAPFRVPRPITPSDLEDIDPNSPQADHSARTRHVRWNFAMDGFVVSEKNVRSPLKTLEKEYVEVRQLLSISGFGLDPSTGRGKPDSRKWRHKLCPRYNEFEAIFENDSATGDLSIIGNDNFSPIDGI
ncbi:hypothetical protein LguiA_029334 [Lonicera macranthoides]